MEPTALPSAEALGYSLSVRFADEDKNTFEAKPRGLGVRTRSGSDGIITRFALIATARRSDTTSPTICNASVESHHRIERFGGCPEIRLSSLPLFEHVDMYQSQVLVIEEALGFQTESVKVGAQIPAVGPVARARDPDPLALIAFNV